MNRIFQSLESRDCDCELIYLEASDFEPELGSTSRNRAIKDLLNDVFAIREFSTFSTDGLLDLESGGWAPQRMKPIFLDVLNDKDLEDSVYVIGEVLEVVLAARAKDLALFLEDLYHAVHANDLFIMEQDAKWLLQFSRHGQFAFGRRQS